MVEVMPVKKYIILLLLLLCLSGCSSPKNRTVSFWDGEKLLAQQTVSETELPAPFTPDAPSGLQFVGWEEEMDSQRTDYHVQFAPVLNQHVPYLFSDELGFLRPQEPMNGDMLKAALFALAAPEAKQFFPNLPAGTAPLKGEAISEILANFFPNQSIVLPDSVTRAAFAEEMNTLLNRRFEVIQPLSPGFPDLSPEHPSYAELVEAAVAHEEGFIRTKDVLLDTGWSKGWHVIEGKLYYTDEYCCLIINQAKDGFQFDENGCYTSGNPELDGYVTELLAGFQEENPEADRMELLKMAYEHCRDAFMYLNREAYPVGETGWEIQDAITMLSTGKGNCYKYSAAFWALARGLGYDATAVAGMINVHPHAWVIIHEKDAYYYCDPELEMTRRAEHQYDWNLFMQERSTMKNWEYGEPEGLIPEEAPIDPKRK